MSKITKKSSRGRKSTKPPLRGRPTLPVATVPRAEQIGWDAVERVLNAAETMIEIAAIERIASNKELIDSFVETLP